jgi:NAD(P)-dependent dehydrogenase (short-subunit alcohol dehydrogenase family)
MMTCEGKIAIVTGATGGIGLAAAKKLIGEGAIVYPLVRRVEAMDEIAAGWGNATPGRAAGAIRFDAWDLAAVRPAIEAVYADAGRIDIFVNNAIASQGAGGGNNTTVVDTDHETMMNMFKAVMGVTAECMRVVIPLMIQGGGGSIVNLSSLAGNQADMTRSYYGIFKSAVNMLTKDVALQYGRQGIRCNAVLPGFTVGANTLDVLPKEFVEQWLKHAPIRRLGAPEDQANAIAFFAGNQSEWVTGQCLEVSGGYGLGAPVFGDIVEPASPQ